jgi:DNA-directed RNA polymerase II subunit RPB1
MPFMMNLLMWVDYDLEKGLPQPAILKPKPLWTGKQVLSLVIPEPINLQLGGDNFIDKKDSTIVIQDGEIMQGIIQKRCVGSGEGGLIHVTLKDLGIQACCDVLSNIQYVVNNWLVNTGFTVGVADIIAKPSVVKEVRQKLVEFEKKVLKVIKTT